MIGSLRGTVVDRGPGAGGAGELLVEVGGVGYRVTVTPATLAATHIGEPAFLYVHTHVREDALVLYGFLSGDDRACFQALVGTPGVGPALALAILSVLSPPGLRQALVCDDSAALTAVPGIGKKTAARLLIDLKSRLELPDGVDLPSGAGHGARGQVRTALAGLGYGPEEVREAMQELSGQELSDDAGVEDLLKSALRSLAGSRAAAR